MNSNIAKTIAAAVVISALLVPAQAKPSKHAASTGGSPAIVGGVWNKLLTHCGGSYFYVGSVFDRSGMLHSVQANTAAEVTEYKNVKFNVVPVRITEAERMNGIEYRARISMMAGIYRTGDEGWTDGPGMRPRNTEDIFAKVLQSVNGDSFGLGGGGAMTFNLVKIKGIWAISRSMQDMSTSLGDWYDAEKLIAAPAPRYSCRSKSVEVSQN